MDERAATLTDAAVVAQAPVVSETIWHSATGPMLIQTCAVGSVWVNGKPVRDTLPHAVAPADASTGIGEGL